MEHLSDYPLTTRDYEVEVSFMNSGVWRLGFRHYFIGEDGQRAEEPYTHVPDLDFDLLPEEAEEMGLEELGLNGGMSDTSWLDGLTGYGLPDRVRNYFNNLPEYTLQSREDYLNA